PGQSQAVFLTQNLRDPSIAHGAPWVNPEVVPADFERNVGIGSAIGLVTYGMNLDTMAPGVYSLVADCTFVNNETGWSNNYGRQVTVRNTKFIGVDPAAFGVTAFLQSGIVGNVETAFINLQNVTVDGYASGYAAPSHGVNTVQGGFLNGIIKL